MAYEITYGFPGRIAFPEVPANLIAQPSLVWLLGSGVDTQNVEVTYITQNLTWQSDYVMVVDDSDTFGDLNGCVTLRNHTGTRDENAHVKLVAGYVQTLAPPGDI